MNALACGHFQLPIPEVLSINFPFTINQFKNLNLSGAATYQELLYSGPMSFNLARSHCDTLAFGCAA
jgi:hypothetical protein